jgi:hypothetical protein
MAVMLVTEVDRFALFLLVSEVIDTVIGFECVIEIIHVIVL